MTGIWTSKRLVDMPQIAQVRPHPVIQQFCDVRSIPESMPSVTGAMFGLIRSAPVPDI